LARQQPVIRTVDDFLKALREKELAAISRVAGVSHPGMIGDMFEGLTRHLLELTLFADLDLRVVQGLIRDSAGNDSDQLDCMVVVGEGERIPHTDHYIYNIAHVLAVIEVKKSLYGTQLSDAYSNLLSVVERAEPQSLARKRILGPFRTVTGVAANEEHLETLPVTQQAIYHCIVGEALLPVRIALGYYGYATEHSLREGLWQYLDRVSPALADAPAVGYGPHSLPNLIVAGNNALVKLTGTPYAIRGRSDEWILYGSVRGAATLVLLELIWSRLASHFNLDVDIFGEDLDIEYVTPLISARLRELENGVRGWEYDFHDVSAKSLLAQPSWVAWQPVALNELQFAAITFLCKKDEIRPFQDSDLHSYLHGLGHTVTEYIDEVLRTGLVFLTSDGALRLNTDSCLCAIDPQLGYLAAENADGRFARWIAKRTAERRASQNK
jgi:hypothetical protein